MKTIFPILFLIVSLIPLASQERTVGLLSYDESQTLDGYNLIFPHGQSTTYLLNNCGEVVHTWPAIEDHVPGNSAYLLEDGTLIRCYRYFNPTNDTIWAGGGGQYVEARDWDGNVLWTFEQNDTLRRIHHDIEIMPNGNILMISWEKKTREESEFEGRDPNNINLGKLWPDYVLEYDPVLDSVVWEWYTWDHLVQDFDPAKNNFGPVATNSGLIDINFETNMGNADWHHMNSIHYHPELDQIMLSVPHFNEIWIIDHSTTTEEAKGSTGGNSGKGGDLLFRWGNPLAYKAGSAEDQLAFFQHDAHWIREFIDPSDPLYDKILFFNNRVGEDFSTVNIITPDMEEDGYNYKQDETGLFLPLTYDTTIQHPEPTKLFSTGLSSAQYLPNGNFLILSGRFGYAFELTPENEVVWEYKVPLSGGMPVEQGAELNTNANLTFRMKRYPASYSAFEGRDLSTKGLIQIEVNNDLCNRIVNTEDLDGMTQFKIFPNPVEQTLYIDLDKSKDDLLQIFDLGGRLIKNITINQGRNSIDVSDLEAGYYMIKVGRLNKKLMKIN